MSDPAVDEAIADEVWGRVPRQREPERWLTAEWLAAYIKEIADLPCVHEDDDPLCAIMHPVVGPLHPVDYLDGELPGDPYDPYVVAMHVENFAAMLADRIERELG